MEAATIGPKPCDAAIGAAATTRRRAVVAVRDDALRSAIRSLLVRIGVRGVGAATADAALEACAGPVELVILDCALHGATGDDGRQGLCRRMSALPGMRHVPVVALCAEEDTFARAACLDGGARVCLAAPFDAGSLLRALAPVMSLDAHGQIELVRLIDQDRGLPLPWAVGG